MREHLLARHFLQRFLDNDLISPSADRHETLAVTCAALMTAGLFVTVLLSLKYLFQPFQSPGRTALPALEDRVVYIASSMIVMALVAVATWDGLALDERDTAILGPLPVARDAIVRAKLAAVALFAGGFAAALNLAPSVAFPVLMVAKLPIGVLGMLTLIFVHAAITTAAGVFGFTSVLALRGILQAALGHVWFRRISTVVQGSLVVLFSTALLLLPAWSGGTRSCLAGRGRACFAIPPLWFLGLHETLGGEAIGGLPRGSLPPSILEVEVRATALYRSERVAFQALGLTAVAGLGIAVLIAVSTYAWNARRLPAPLPRSPGGRRRAVLWNWVVIRFVARRPVARAGFFFTLHALSRSVPHRLTIATSAAVGLAAATVSVRGRDLGRALDLGSMPVSFVAVQSMVLIALLVGFRHALRIPASLQANWALHLAWPGDERQYFAGVKRAALAGLVLPVLVALLPVHAWVLGWRAGLAHFACGVLMASLLVEVLLLGFRKVPFASSYEPSGNLKALGPIYVLGFLLVTYGLGFIERFALGSARGTIVFLLGTAMLWAGVRLVDLRGRRTPASMDLEESPAASAQRLGLSG